MLDGRKLFNMYVSRGLCSSWTYVWEELSAPMQQRWNALAIDINKMAREAA